MCVCERIAAGGERVSPSIHKCANPMRNLKAIESTTTNTLTTNNTTTVSSPSPVIIDTDATLTSITSTVTADSAAAKNTIKNNLKNNLIITNNNNTINSNNAIINTNESINNNNINSPSNNSSSNISSNNNINLNSNNINSGNNTNHNNNSIVNTKNNINSNNKLTNVMDKLDPSLHCFLSPSLVSLYSFSLSSSPVNDELEPTSSEIAKRIEDFLKQRKIIRNSTDLPANLTKKVAQDIIGMSETEPCGLQGCLLYIMLEDEDHKAQTLGSIKLGEKTIVPTFVIYLHLRRQYSDWLKFIAARFLRNLFRDSSYTMHEVYKLYKRKLFRNLDPLVS